MTIALPRPRLSRPRLVVAAVAALLALGTVVSGVGAGLVAAADSSPARGHAGVIAQGVAELPDDDLTWRVAERRAEPREDASAVAGDLGFVLADGDAIFVAGEDGRQERLAPGEAAFAPDGVRQERSALGTRSVDYLALELVAASEAEAAGDGDLVYAGDGFAGPGEERDLDLVRDVLASGESGELSTGDLPALILVTEGEIEIELAGRREPIALRAGQAIQVDGELTISAVEGGEDAAYVAAVIGPAIPDEAEEREPVVVVRTAAATPAPTAAPVATGSLVVSLRACPEGMTLPTLVEGDCGLAGGGATLRLIDRAGIALEPVFDPAASTLTWSGIGLAEYELVVTRLPGSVESVALDGVACCDAAGGWSISLDRAAPSATRTLYHFAFLPDTDGDRIPDADERGYGTDPTRADSDGDGLNDGEEVFGYTGFTTDPTLPDTDGDTLSDGDEVLVYFTDPTSLDSDGDTLFDDAELFGLNALGFVSDPTNDHSDGDGLRDDVEVLGLNGPTYFSDPTVEDSDADGLRDDEEVNGVYGWATDPLLPDHDLDLLLDGEEVLGAYGHFTDPTRPDTDGDGLNDGEEVFATYGYVSDPTTQHSDGDGLRDDDEVFGNNAYGFVSDPMRDFSDGDALSDAEEVLGTFGFYSNPLVDYSDGDSLRDDEEVFATYGYVSDPMSDHSDGDGFDDGTEASLGFNPMDTASHP